MTTAQELLDEADDRQGEHSGRLQAYRTFVNAYFSDTPDTSSGMGVQGSYADGRVAMIMRQIEDNLDGRQGAPKLIKPMVDDIVAIRGVLPSISVIAEDVTEAAEAEAAKRTRALRQQWHYSRMRLKQPRAAWSAAAKGDVLYVLNPRFPDEADEAKDPFKPAGVYIDVVPVETAFPKMRVGEDFDQLEDLFIITEISDDDAERLYGVVNWPTAKVKVVVYYDTKVKRVFCGDREVRAPVEHNLGFVPAEWHQNKPTDGRFAQADINDSVELERTMQRQFHVFCDSILWATYPLVVYKNTAKIAGEVQDYGPGAKVEVSADGDVKFLAPAANPAAAEMIYEASKNAIMQQAGVSPVRMQGSIDRSNVTGRAVNAQMSPQEVRLSSANERLAGSLVMLNSKIMLMFHRLAGFQGADIPLDADPKQGVAKSSFSGEDFGGWVANEVEWDSAMHLNAHERLAMGLQLRKEELFSSKRTLQYIGDNDPDRTLREARADVQQRMAQMQQAQQAGAPPGGPPGATPPGSPAPPGGDPTQMAQQGLAMAQGGDGGPPGGAPPDQGAPVQPAPNGAGGGAPRAIAGFPPLPADPGGPPGNPSPVSNPLPKVDAALEGVKLYGVVLQRYPIPGGIRVFVSDHRDIRPVKDALRAALGSGIELDVRTMPKSAAASNGRSR